jgi:hypothetical protein
MSDEYFYLDNCQSKPSLLWLFNQGCLDLEQDLLFLGLGHFIILTECIDCVDVIVMFINYQWLFATV